MVGFLALSSCTNIGVFVEQNTVFFSKHNKSRSKSQHGLFFTKFTDSRVIQTDRSGAVIYNVSRLLLPDSSSWEKCGLCAWLFLARTSSNHSHTLASALMRISRSRLSPNQNTPFVFCENRRIKAQSGPRVTDESNLLGYCWFFFFSPSRI